MLSPFSRPQDECPLQNGRVGSKDLEVLSTWNCPVTAAQAPPRIPMGSFQKNYLGRQDREEGRLDRSSLSCSLPYHHHMIVSRNKDSRTQQLQMGEGGAPGEVLPVPYSHHPERHTLLLPFRFRPRCPQSTVALAQKHPSPPPWRHIPALPWVGRPDGVEAGGRAGEDSPEAEQRRQQII